MIKTAKQTLQSVFGYQSFRPLQEEIIEHVLNKNDALVIMPTGGGKSLCYQLPALLFEGLTVVVSPLISLMKDQVEQLREFNVQAVYLNSTLSQQEYRQNMELIKREEIKLLYLAPETLLMSRTLDLLSKLSIDCFTIDEAHCISEWGHDFRPEYRQLAGVRKHFSNPVTISLTATATPRVQNDIKNTLQLDETETFIASFDRKNLFLEIHDKQYPLDQVLAFLEKHKGQSGIIYCFSRNQVDELHADLAHEGYSSRPYHAGLSETERNQNQDAFIRDDVDIIVATIAFGMGINKPDVRFVIHHDLPQNIESYYQQIGRAGRDGLRADCLLLFSYADTQKIQYFINQKSEQEQRVAQRHLNSLVSFTESGECRRIPLMDYFGEVYPSDECGMCDNCLSDNEDIEDLTVPAQKFLSCIVRTGQLFGASHIASVLRGSEAKKVLNHGHEKLPTYGIGRELSKKQWGRLARQLIRQGYLNQDPEFGSLKLRQPGVAVLKGDEAVYGKITAPTGSPGRKPETPVEELDYDHELFELLRRKRKKLADQAGVPPYVIFPDNTLIEMAWYYPQQVESLQNIHGIGAAKLKKYGAIFSEVIREYCNGKNINERIKTARRRSSSKSNRKRRRHHQIGEAFNSGQSISSLIKEYNVRAGTVLKHLRTYLLEGNTLRSDGLLEFSELDEKKIKQAMLAFEKLGTEFLRPVYDEFEGTISYDELKVVRLYYLISSEI